MLLKGALAASGSSASSWAAHSLRARLLGLATLMVFAPLACVEGQAPSVVAPSPFQIVTSAEGEATVVPDRAVISFAVETRASTAAAAGAENARRQQAVIGALRAKGVATEHITTAGFSVSPDERYDDGQRKVTGYIARNGVVIAVHKVDQIGGLIDAALGAGANSVGGLRFYSSRLEEVRRSALRQAVERARADAEVMARAVSGTLDNPIEMTTNDVGMPLPLMDMVSTSALRVAGAPETPVEVGEQKVSMHVTTRWVFIPPR